MTFPHRLLDGYRQFSTGRLQVEQDRYRELAEHGQSEKSISAIAFEWGFNSSAHFSRLFKSQVGVAPTSYRRNLIASAPL